MPIFDAKNASINKIIHYFHKSEKTANTDIVLLTHSYKGY